MTIDPKTLIDIRTRHALADCDSVIGTMTLEQLQTHADRGALLLALADAEATISILRRTELCAPQEKNTRDDRADAAADRDAAGPCAACADEARGEFAASMHWCGR